ncbi:MAG: 2-C-methyl-D-erythritol 4-phosphate cytidylyltransferase [Pseudomonadota bacterium]
MNAAIIVAAGEGIRMGGPVRKQYLQLGGSPILSHTLRVFDSSPDIHQICLVVPEGEIVFCRQFVLPPVMPRTPLTVVPGGPTRQDSVWNGLMTIIDSSDIVIIHDGVRPFVTSEQLSACIQMAALHGACILGIPATDTLKTVSADGHIGSTLDRKNIWLAQTPQAFRYELIRKAHERSRKEGITGTDDAELLEKTLGGRIKIIPGSRNNIKITTPEDLLLARFLLKAHRITRATSGQSHVVL